MASFSFRARDPAGKTRQGAVAAASYAAAVTEIRGRGWLVLDVRNDLPAAPRVKPTAVFRSGLWLPPRNIDIEVSLRQMAVMLRSGLTLLSALNAVAEYSPRRSMGRIWQNVADRIQEGASLADAMSQIPRFSQMVVQLIRVGEQTGHLEPVLLRAAERLEHGRRIRASLITALFYPMIVLVLAIGVTAFMAFSVIPKLEKFLATIGRRLPAMTQLLLDISGWLHAYSPHVAVAAIAFVAAGVALYLWPPGRMAIDRRLLRIPVAGKIFRLAGTVSFAGGLSALLHSGITLLEGLRTAERLQSNRYLARQVAAAREAVLRGGSLAEPLGRDRVWMPLLSRMVAVGESAGTLDEILDEVAKFYEAQLQAAIRMIALVIEPVIILVVGGIVGFVYISFFMALFAAGGAAR
jgi:type II secretory pathway component PulF